jgi:nucleoside-diphosphate-sugar epimerase
VSAAPALASPSRHVLVTGGTGFLGRRLCAELRRRGHVVRVLVRRHTPAVSALAAAGAQCVRGDVRDAATLRAAIDRVDTVFHLAGRLLRHGEPASLYEGVHVEGTRNLLDACRTGRGLRAVVHCSTTGVLGPTGPAAVSEDAPARPSNVYERTKAEGESLARDLARSWGLPLVIARPALVYGPGDLHLLSWFRAIHGGYYRVVGRGDNVLHPVYVDDVVEGLLRCAEPPARDGRVYNLVGERPLPIRELAAEIGRAVSRPLSPRHVPLGVARAIAALLEAVPGLPASRLPLTRGRITFMTESRAYSGARARDELGFMPAVDLPTGLRRTVAWYRGEGLL